MLISRKYGYSDLRLYKAMIEYQKSANTGAFALCNLNISSCNKEIELDSLFIKFDIICEKHNISPDTLASAIIDFETMNENY